MPPRRLVVNKSPEGGKNTTTVEATTEIAAPLSLDSGGSSDEEAGLDSNDPEETIPLNENGDDDGEYQKHKHSLCVKSWKESPFACGLTHPNWSDQITDDGSLSARLPPDETGCLCCSALVCPLFRAGRVGNMAVLKSSHEVVEEIVRDEETGQETVRTVKRPKLDVVVGPYWPMMCFVTYPLILGVSFWTFYSGILPGGKPPVLVFVWLVCTTGLIVALALTACKDPGVLYRHRQPPPDDKNDTWRWSDQADSYRPRDAWFDSDTAVVVEGFDHTCPWTGTAIGKKNMFPFQLFVGLVFLCMIIDIFILTGAFG